MARLRHAIKHFVYAEWGCPYCRALYEKRRKRWQP